MICLSTNIHPDLDLGINSINQREFFFWEICSGRLNSIPNSLMQENIIQRVPNLRYDVIFLRAIVIFLWLVLKGRYVKLQTRTKYQMSFYCRYFYIFNNHPIIRKWKKSYQLIYQMSLQIAFSSINASHIIP